MLLNSNIYLSFNYWVTWNVYYWRYRECSLQHVRPPSGHQCGLYNHWHYCCLLLQVLSVDYWLWLCVQPLFLSGRTSSFRSSRYSIRHAVLTSLLFRPLERKGLWTVKTERHLSMSFACMVVPAFGYLFQDIDGVFKCAVTDSIVSSHCQLRRLNLFGIILILYMKNVLHFNLDLWVLFCWMLSWCL